jgi:hypothetical protein
MTRTRTTARNLRRLALATTLAVGATFAGALVSGATTSHGPTPSPGERAPAIQATPPPRFLPVIGPNGKPVVDENGQQLIMDTAPETGRPNPHGQTVIATIPPALAAQHAGEASTAAPTIVRPYDDTKYHER